MRMNAVNLLAALVTIFGVGSGYVVLKQGNWYNPQATVDNSPGTKPKTWVAVRIDGERKVDLPHYVADCPANCLHREFLGHCMSPCCG